MKPIELDKRIALSLIEDIITDYMVDYIIDTLIQNSCLFYQYVLLNPPEHNKMYFNSTMFVLSKQQNI